MSHHMHFFRGAQDNEKSKNDYCYKCLKFEKRLLVGSAGLKMLLRKK